MGGQWLPQNSDLTGRGLITKNWLQGSDMLEIEIDGKKAQVPDGSTVMDAAQQVGVYISAFLLPQETFDRRQLPDVFGAGGKGAQTVACLCNAGDQRYEGIYAFRSGG